MHINTEHENPSIDSLNKRAKINYKFLSRIDGYDIEYFSSKGFSDLRSSLFVWGVLYKDGLDILPIVSFWNKHRDVVKKINI